MKEQTRRATKYLALAIIFGVCLLCSAFILIDSYETTCNAGCSDNNYTETFGIANEWYGAVIFSLLYLIALYLFIYPEDKKSYKITKLFIHC